MSESASQDGGAPRARKSATEPGHEPGVCDLRRPYAGWRRPPIDVELFRWPDDTTNLSYGEIGLKTVRFRREWIGTSIDFDDAVDIARHWFQFQPDAGGFRRSLREQLTERAVQDWLVVRFVAVARGLSIASEPARSCSIDSIPVHGPMLNEAVVMRCIEAAESSRPHWEALRLAAAFLHWNKQPLGDALAEWLEKADRPPDGRKRPRQSPYDRLRNRAIIAAIKRLVAEGMTATRNETSPEKSACDAVATASGLSYDVVLKTWKSADSQPF